MIWLIGNKGMLGQQLSRLLDKEMIPFSGTDKEISILEPGILEKTYRVIKPEIIINCSAYTAVDKAELEKETAFAINCTGPANLARLSSEKQIPFVHISTDYVFDGTSDKPLSEESQTGPTGVYGLSKLAGEEEIRLINPNHFIIRTAWLYGQYGSNFVYTMIKLMNKRDILRVVSDQRGSPTWTYDLAQAIVSLVKKQSVKQGTYHFSNEGDCSWFEFALEIYRSAGIKGLITGDCTVSPCSSEEYPTQAKRPAYSLLSKEKIKDELGIRIPSWKESLYDFINSIRSEDII